MNEKDSQSSFLIDVFALDVPDHSLLEIGSAHFSKSGGDLFLTLRCVPLVWKGRMVVKLKGMS